MATETLNTVHAQTHIATTDHKGQHHGGPKVYGAVLTVLLILTGITVAVSYVQFGTGMANVIIAMLIASIKASLVALFFMHLRWDKPVSAITFCAALFFLALFLMGCYTDYVSRPPSEPANMKTATPPGGPVPPAVPAGGPSVHENAVNPSVPNAGHATGSADHGAGGPAVQGASPQGNSGGPMTGKESPSPQVPTHQQ